MLMKLTSIAVCGLLSTAVLWPQTPSTPSPAANQAIGEVTALNATAGQISLRTDNGESLTVVAGPNTTIRKVPAGAQSLATAVRIELAGVGVGDRISAAGQWSGDRSRIEARSIVVMSRSDLDEKRRLEQEDWRKRGISGTVSSIDSGGKTFTIQSGARKILVQLSTSAQLRRYAPDSVRFSDARPSSFAAIQVGDQARLLGTKGADGTTYTAEIIISGSFGQLAATIVSVNQSLGEIVVEDLATKKNLTVRINGDSVVRRLPPQVAASLAARYRQNGSTGGGEAAQRGASDDLGQALDHLPAVPVANLKPGEAIMLATTNGSDPGRVTAVMMLAGVESLLTASPNATRDILSGWNLGGDTAQ
jgi:hypothetical protein